MENGFLRALHEGQYMKSRKFSIMPKLGAGGEGWKGMEGFFNAWGGAAQDAAAIKKGLANRSITPEQARVWANIETKNRTANNTLDAILNREKVETKTVKRIVNEDTILRDRVQDGIVGYKIKDVAVHPSKPTRFPSPSLPAKPEPKVVVQKSHEIRRIAPTGHSDKKFEREAWDLIDELGNKVDELENQVQGLPHSLDVTNHPMFKAQKAHVGTLQEALHETQQKLKIAELQARGNPSLGAKVEEAQAKMDNLHQVTNDQKAKISEYERLKEEQKLQSSAGADRPTPKWGIRRRT